MNLTEYDKGQLIKYFRYVTLNRRKKKILRQDSIIFGIVFFFYYTLFINGKMNSLNFFQILLLSALALILGSSLVKELPNVKFLLSYFTNKSIGRNIQIELGKIKYLNTDRVDCRVTVVDDSGEVYIADYAPELMSDLYSRSANKCLDAYLIYIKDKKGKYLAAYPKKYFENNN